jgi:hypothetical protein
LVPERVSLRQPGRGLPFFVLERAGERRLGVQSSRLVGGGPVDVPAGTRR